MYGMPLYTFSGDTAAGRHERPGRRRHLVRGRRDGKQIDRRAAGSASSSTEASDDRPAATRSSRGRGRRRPSSAPRRRPRPRFATPIPSGRRRVRSRRANAAGIAFGVRSALASGRDRARAEQGPREVAAGGGCRAAGRAGRRSRPPTRAARAPRGVEPRGPDVVHAERGDRWRLALDGDDARRPSEPAVHVPHEVADRASTSGSSTSAPGSSAARAGARAAGSGARCFDTVGAVGRDRILGFPRLRARAGRESTSACSDRRRVDRLAAHDPFVGGERRDRARHDVRREIGPRVRRGRDLGERPIANRAGVLDQHRSARTPPAPRARGGTRPSSPRATVAGPVRVRGAARSRSSTSRSHSRVSHSASIRCDELVEIAGFDGVDDAITHRRSAGLRRRSRPPRRVAAAAR